MSSAKAQTQNTQNEVLLKLFFENNRILLKRTCLDIFIVCSHIFSFFLHAAILFMFCFFSNVTDTRLWAIWAHASPWRLHPLLLLLQMVST